MVVQAFSAADAALNQQTAVVADILQSDSNFHIRSGTAGELYDQIQKRKQIDEHDARIYAAEIVLMLKRLRQEKVSRLALQLCRCVCLPGFNCATAHCNAHICTGQYQVMP